MTTILPEESEAGDKESLLNVRMSVVEAKKRNLSWVHHDYRRSVRCANEWVAENTECSVCGRYRFHVITRAVQHARLVNAREEVSPMKRGGRESGERLEDLQRFCLVDEETGDIEYGDFTSILGAVLRIFGRPPTHPHPVEDFPLEDDEVEALGLCPGYVIGRVEWSQ